MANAYLVRIHRFLSEKIEECASRRDIAQARGDSAAACFHQGRLEEMEHIRSYLSEHFDLNTQRYY